MQTSEVFSDVKLLHVYHDEALSASRLESLTADEVERHAGFRSAKRRKSFVLGRTAARELAAHVLNVDTSQITFAVDDGGAIDVVGCDQFLSISHSEDRAVAVMAPVPVGVDLEQKKSRIDDLYRFVLHEDEYHLLNNECFDPSDTVLACWSMKEAVLKGMRTGLRVSPKKVRLDVDFNNRSAVASVHDGTWWNLLFDELDDYFLTIARIRTQ